MCNYAVKKLPSLLRFVPGRYKLNKCEKAIIENGGTLNSFPDCYKNQEKSNETVDNYPHVLEFVSDCLMTQETCDKVVNTHSSAMQLVPDCYMTQEMCDTVANTHSSAIQFFSEYYKNQKLCNKSSNNSFLACFYKICS